MLMTLVPHNSAVSHTGTIPGIQMQDPPKPATTYVLFEGVHEYYNTYSSVLIYEDALGGPTS